MFVGWVLVYRVVVSISFVILILVLICGGLCG